MLDVHFDRSKGQVPNNHQELFAYAIRSFLCVAGEFDGYRENLDIYEWAFEYSKQHNLDFPDFEEWMLTYEPDDLENWPNLKKAFEDQNERRET